MASPCDNRLTVNIKNLPIISDISNGDFIIVETSDGTNILDFRNFLITLNNTTFSSTFLNYNTRIIELSTKQTNNTQELTTLINTVSTSTSAAVFELSSSTSAAVFELSSSMINNSTFVTLSSDGAEIVVLNGSNVSNDCTINTDGSFNVKFINNFADSYYCVSTGGYYFNENLGKSVPIYLNVINTDTNSIVILPLSSSSSLPQPFTRGWIRINSN